MAVEMPPESLAEIEIALQREFPELDLAPLRRLAATLGDEAELAAAVAKLRASPVLRRSSAPV